MKTVYIYTDGACSGNQNEQNIGGWGCVLQYGEHIKEMNGGEINTTNNRMEIFALISALSALKEKGLDIRIYSDSSYVINCFTQKWYEGWIKNGWKNSKKQPVENRELWEELLRLMDGQNCSFNLVKGHVNTNWDEAKLKPHYENYKKHNGPIQWENWLYIVKMNNRCDELANIYINVEKNKVE